MGSGKSTVGALLATLSERRFVDVDELVVATAGRSIAEIFARDGEPAFRELERAAVAEALADDGVVVATGGGAVLDPTTRERLADGATVVWLDGASDVLLARIGDVASRPLLTGDDPEAALARTIEQRRPLYEEVADLRIDVADRSPEEIASRILVQLGVPA